MIMMVFSFWQPALKFKLCVYFSVVSLICQINFLFCSVLLHSGDIRDYADFFERNRAEFFVLGRKTFCGRSPQITFINLGHHRTCGKVW